MPLANEAALRTTLDALFFKDRIIARIKTIEISELKKKFKTFAHLEDSALYESVLASIEGHFAGYSIFHVDGRFRSGKLRTQDEVAQFQMKGERYLIDETTACYPFHIPIRG